MEKIKEKSLGEILDNLINNPAVIIKQCGIVAEENKKLNEKIKEKDNEIIFLKGKIEGLLYHIKNK